MGPAFRAYLSSFDGFKGAHGSSKQPALMQGNRIRRSVVDCRRFLLSGKGAFCTIYPDRSGAVKHGRVHAVENMWCLRATDIGSCFYNLIISYRQHFRYNFFVNCHLLVILYISLDFSRVDPDTVPAFDRRPVPSCLHSQQNVFANPCTGGHVHQTSNM